MIKRSSLIKIDNFVLKTLIESQIYRQFTIVGLNDL